MAVTSCHPRQRCRQAETERRTLARLPARLDDATMTTHDALHGGQADAGKFFLPVQTLEGLEQAWLLSHQECGVGFIAAARVQQS